MKNNELLECGKIVNTHGIRGEVKIVPWADSPEFICDLPAIYIDGKPVKIRNARVHKGNVIALLEGIVLDKVPEGRYFLSAAPMNLGGADGAPCRAYLIESVGL